MTRPIMAYAALAGLGAGLAMPVQAQERSPVIEQLMRVMKLRECAKKAGEQLNTTVDLMGNGTKVGVIVPAPAPHTGKFDGCVIHEDGSLTDTKGRAPIPGRPACAVADLIKKCMAGEEPAPVPGS